GGQREPRAHRSGPAVEPHREPLEAAALGRALERLDKQDPGGEVARERRAGVALPAGFLELEELLGPGIDILVAGGAQHGELALLGEAAVLAAQLLALLAAERVLEIGF